MAEKLSVDNAQAVTDADSQKKQYGKLSNKRTR